MGQDGGRDLRLEPARPHQCDAAAPLMWDTNPSFFAYLFGGDEKTALRFLARQFEAERSIYSHAHCTTALAGDRLLGIELGWDRDTQRELLGETMQLAAALLSVDQLAHFRAASSLLLYLAPPIPRHTYYVLHLAAARDGRGKGMGARLLNEAFARARARGYPQCQLDVAKENRAVQSYQRLGMEVLSESRVPRLEKHGLGANLRMVKELNEQT
jgi:ribosomal protein S18 acetylase RimI-like enzyme